MDIFLIFGLMFGAIGFIVGFVGTKELLDNPYDFFRLEGAYTIAAVFVKISVLLIVVWLFMRATGFRIGYVISLFVIIGGVVFGYLAEMANGEKEYGEFIFKKYIFLALGFIMFVISAMAATS